MGAAPLIIPAHVAAAAQQRTQVCGNCKWRHHGPETKGDVECRLYPPFTSLNMVPVPNAIQRQGQMAMALQATSVMTIVRDDMWCGQWTAREQDLQ